MYQRRFFFSLSHTQTHTHCGCRDIICTKSPKNEAIPNVSATGVVSCPDVGACPNKDTHQMKGSEPEWANQQPITSQLTPGSIPGYRLCEGYIPADVGTDPVVVLCPDLEDGVWACDYSCGRNVGNSLLFPGSHAPE